MAVIGLQSMICRKGCGACCISISISSPLPLMPGGKAAGMKCLHLREDYSCGIYENRPKVCREFRASEEYCGSNRYEALVLLSDLERNTAP